MCLTPTLSVHKRYPVNNKQQNYNFIFINTVRYKHSPPQTDYFIIATNYIVLALCILVVFLVFSSARALCCPPIDWPLIGSSLGGSFFVVRSRTFSNAFLLRSFCADSKSASALANLFSASVWSSGLSSNSRAEGRLPGSGCIINRSMS